MGNYTQQRTISTEETRLCSVRLTEAEREWCKRHNGIAEVVRMAMAREAMATSGTLSVPSVPVPLASARREDVGLKPMRLKSVSSFDPDEDGGAQ